MSGTTVAAPARAAVRPAVAARHFPALDGIRAIAVVAVLLYHFGVPHSTGGFLGVDLFFVLSGYLITGQLVTRWLPGAATVGRESFKAFWGARARRLFPSLAAMLAVTTAAVAVGDRQQLGVYRGDLAAAATYTSNWWYVFHHRSYFVAAGRPPLLQHLWSLAVEEQFYLAWPVVILVITMVVRRRWARRGVLLIVSAVLTLASASVMGLGSALSQVPELGDPSRFYFGSDSHAIGLLVGSTLAVARGGDGLGGGRPAPVRSASLPVTIAGWTGLAAVFAFLSQAGEYSTWLYRGGFLVFSLLGAVVVAVAVRPGPLERVLGMPVLTAIGRRSYSMYLWHWPVACLTRPGLDLPWSGWQVLLLRVAVTLLLTEGTYRFIECPVRRHGWPAVWCRLRSVRLGWFGAPAVLGATALVLVGAICAPAGVALPHQTSYAAGGVYVRCDDGADGRPHFPTSAPAGARCAAVDPSPAPSGTRTSALHRPVATAPPPAGRAAGKTPSPSASAPSSVQPTTRQAVPTMPAGAEQLRSLSLAVYGDSVPLGAMPELAGEFASVTNHAIEGAQSWDLLPELTRDGRTGALNGKVVLLHTGDNGLIAPSQLRDALAALTGARRVIVATPHTPRPWEQTNVATVRKVVPAYPNAVLLHWNSAVADRGSWLWNDGIHLTPGGGQAYAHLVAAAALQP